MRSAIAGARPLLPYLDVRRVGRFDLERIHSVRGLRPRSETVVWVSLDIWGAGVAYAPATRQPLSAESKRASLGPSTTF